MSIKKSADPILDEIREILIDPILLEKPDNTELSDKEWVEDIFKVELFPIKKYKVIKTFYVPGLECIDKIHGTISAFRWADKDKILIARFHDISDPNCTIEIEVELPPKNIFTSFKISKKQWLEISRNLKEI